MSQPFVRILRNTIAFLLLAQISTLALMGTGAGLPFTAASDSATEISSTDGSGEEAGTTTTSASSTTTSSTGESPPAVEAVITGTLGDDGWYTTDVTVDWTITDDETPATPGEGCVQQSVTADTTGTAFECTATSDGGSTTTVATIARDATAPADVTVTADRAPDHGDWYNAPFTATWSGSDATSGIASCTTTNYSGPDADGSLDGTCEDNAGNESAAVAFAFKFDATAPAVTATPDRSADHDGWYNAPVTITFASEDTNATCDEPVVYSGPDTATASVSGSCTDQAGNSASASFAFKFDATAPTIDLRTPSADAIYILNQPVAADYDCADLALVSCTGTVADGAALDTASVGTKSFEVVATDEAGNSTTRSISYQVQYQPAGVECGDVAGHQILRPIEADGSRTFNGGSTVPAKFRVCDFYGEPVTTAGVVEKFRLVKIGSSDTDQAPTPTNKKEQFRAGDSQWIYNISTKGLPQGEKLGYRIWLNDGTAIDFGFTLK